MTKRIKEIVAEILAIEVENIQDDASIIDDLGADSIAVMEIVMELESEMGIVVPIEEIHQLKTVNEINAYIQSKSS